MLNKKEYLKNFFQNIELNKENLEFQTYKKLFEILEEPSEKLINFIYECIEIKLKECNLIEWKDFSKKLLLLKTKENLENIF